MPLIECIFELNRVQFGASAFMMAFFEDHQKLDNSIYNYKKTDWIQALHSFSERRPAKPWCECKSHKVEALLQCQFSQLYQ